MAPRSSQSSARGERETASALGEAVEQAAKLEERIEYETGISSTAHAQLPEEIGSLFQWKKELQCFVSRNRVDVLERADESRKDEASADGVGQSERRGRVGVSRSVAGAQRAAFEELR